MWLMLTALTCIVSSKSVGAVSSDVAVVLGVPLTGWESMNNMTNLDGLPKVIDGMGLY